jgi:predicted restriction endonuclease
MSSIVGIRRPGRQRGGRHKQGFPEYNKVSHHIVVDDEFWAMLEAERRAEETNNDALWRIFKTRTKDIHDLRKKVDALIADSIRREETSMVVKC